MATGPPMINHPYDVALPHPALEDSDSPASQSDLHEATLTNAPYDRTGDEDNFYQQPRITRDLSFMEGTFSRGNRRTAMEILAKRHEIEWRNSEYHVRADDPMLTWQVDQHYIDMTICVARGLGLRMLLPNTRDHDFSFDFDFRQKHIRFSAKFAKLGFDPKASFLWIGRSRSEDVFIAWAPNDTVYTESSDDTNTGRASDGSTRLNDKHYFITVMLFAFMIKKLGHRGIWVDEEYPELDDEQNVQDATNIL